MQHAGDIELIFPIKNAASAALMVIKADCLRNAGVISDGEKQWVYSRARPFLADGAPKDAASHLEKCRRLMRGGELHQEEGASP
jgi:hypothetical protein